MKLLRISTSQQHRGMVLFMALMVLIPVAALTYGLMSIGVAFSGERMSSIEDEQALFLADAGLDEAVLALRNGGTGNIGSEVAPVYFGRGLYWVEADFIGVDLIRLQSTAMYEGGRRSIESLVFRDNDDFRGMTIFANDDLTIGAQAFFDSFDSTLGTYDSQVSGGYVNQGAIIESNGDIIVESSVEVHGDTHPGPGYEVEAPGSSSLSGNQQPNEEIRTLEPVVVPVIASTGALWVAASQTLPSGDYNFSSMDIGTGADLTITGPARVVVDNMDLRSNSTLLLDTAGGAIEFFISGTFAQASNSSIDVTAPSAELLTLNFTGGPGQVINLQSNSDFYGVIYAPEGTVEISSNFEIFGAVVADNVILNANVQVHYDESLTNSLGVAYTFTVTTWTLTEFPVRAFAANRSDPFRLVGIDRNALDLPEAGREVLVP